MAITTNREQTITVTYTPLDPNDSTTPKIDIGDAPNVPWNTQTTFNLVRRSSNFDFKAISFKGVDHLGNPSNVWKTFEKFRDGVASFRGSPYVTQIDVHSKDSISFTVVNRYDNKGGILHFQVTIADKKLLYTSLDPQIELEEEESR